jgi:hypothetical protein
MPRQGPCVSPICVKPRSAALGQSPNFRSLEFANCGAGTEAPVSKPIVVAEPSDPEWHRQLAEAFTSEFASRDHRRRKAKNSTDDPARLNAFCCGSNIRSL